MPNRRVAETFAAELRSLILAAEGYQLPTQDELVRDFGVSYPSVREALRILETEGLVTVRRGSVGGADIHRPEGVSAAYHIGLALQAAGATLRDLAQGLLKLEPAMAARCGTRPCDGTSGPHYACSGRQHEASRGASAPRYAYPSKV